MRPFLYMSIETSVVSFAEGHSDDLDGYKNMGLQRDRPFSGPLFDIFT